MTAHNKSLDEIVGVADSLLVVNPAIAVADTVRTSASTLLRLLRRPVRYVRFELGPQFGDLEPGDWLFAAHELLPEPPTGYEAWRLIPLYVVEVADPLSQARIEITCIDLREVWASWWSPLQTEVGMTDELNGIAMLDRAGGWQTERDQVGYGIRPPGDDAWQEVLANTPIVDSYGLRLEGGDDVNFLLNSTFSEGSGDTFTSWTKTTTGAAIGVQWQLYTLIDATGFRRATQIATYATGEQAYYSQTVNNMEDKLLAVKVYYKDGGAVDRMGLRISRSDTGEYFRDSDGTWQGSVQTISVTPASGVIDTPRYVTKGIDTTAAGSLNITVEIGHFSAAYNGAQISQIQGVELIDLLRRYYAFRSPLPTKDAAVTREPNRTWIVNDSAVRVLSPTRGFFKCSITPGWSHTDLANTDFKYIWAADFDGVTDSQFLRCYYVRVDASNGEYRFRNGDGSPSETVVAVSGADLPVEGETYTIICRWTSEDENEHDMVGQALDIWFGDTTGNFTRGTPAEDCDTMVADASCNVYLGSTITTDLNMLDGHMTNVTIDDRCPSEAELLRI